MAKLDFSGLGEVESMIIKEPELLSKAVPEMLRAGAAVVIQTQKAEASGMGIRRTGALIGSIGVYKEVYDGLRPRIIIFPTGANAKGTRNALVGAIMNYGVKRGAKRPNFRIAARPYMAMANASAEEGARAAMEKIWEGVKSDGG